MSTDNSKTLVEVPSSLKQLARLVVRGFYTIEDSLIIDMLVRNPCMKEDDICDLLKFDRKMLRARINTLKNDKFIQVKLRMETGSDGKAQKVNYYFINYKIFVNVVKYKLDVMTKKMETEERDATSRASFKCPSCLKTFTDLDIGQLYDKDINELRCSYCKEIVEEDQSALPKTNSRLLMARYNDQLGPLYTLLQEVEGIKLSPELLEPEPTDINALRGIDTKKSNPRGPNEQWSGESTRSTGFAVEDARVDVLIGDEIKDDVANKKKERPIWLMESTVITSDVQNELGQNSDGIMDNAANAGLNTTNKQGEDIMSVLLAHEKKGGLSASAVKTVLTHESSDSSDNEDVREMQTVDNDQIEVMESEDDDEIPTVNVNGKKVAITDVNDKLIAEMTAEEKETYIQVYQDFYSSMYD